MRILADENCDGYLIEQLRAKGHDVIHAAESLRGNRDSSILEEAARADRILLTNDLDFGLLVERSERRPPADVLLRLHPLRARTRAAIAVDFFASIGSNFRDQFIVVEPGLVRQRVMLP